MRELNVQEINAVSGSGEFLDTAGYGTAGGSLVGLFEAGLAGQGGLAAAGTIGAWGVIGGALALEGYLVYEAATYLGAGKLGEWIVDTGSSFSDWVSGFFN